MDYVKELTLSLGKGTFDSLTGLYYLFDLHFKQTQALKARKEFAEIREVSRSKQPAPSSDFKNTKPNESRLLYTVSQCCLLNGMVFLCSVIVFEHALMPFLQFLMRKLIPHKMDNDESFWFWLSSLLNYAFGVVWVLPVFVVSRLINAFWYQDIASIAYRYSVGRPKDVSNYATFIAENFFSLVIQTLFLLQACLCLLLPLPYMSDLLYIIHLALLYSLYSFDYKWTFDAWPLHKRLNYIETHWAYFIGFGLPLTGLSYFTFVYSGCLFALLFPIFIISGNMASVRVINRNTPQKKLKLFTLIVYLSNRYFKSKNK